MASVVLEQVVVDFPIYGTQRSWRNELFNRAVGGAIRRENGHRINVRAIDGVNLTINHGDRIGLIGHNGAGKSTLLRVLAGVYKPSSGVIRVEGRVSPLFNSAPGLDLDDTGYENMLTCGLYLGMTRQEIASKIPDIAQFTELGDYLSLPVRTYSAGMLMRLGFAIASALDPEILLLDEGLGAGDARFAERAAKRIDALIERSSILVLATHSDVLIRQMCNKCVLMARGVVTAEGGVEEMLERYQSTQTHQA